MCRSIKQLRQPDRLPTKEEIDAAALQFVRKVSGYRKPSRANQAAFDRAVLEIAASTRVLIEAMPQPRAEVEAGTPVSHATNREQ